MTWLEVRWNDAPNSMHLLLDKVRMEKGDLEIRVLDPWGGSTSRIVQDQIVKTHGPLQVPDL